MHDTQRLRTTTAQYGIWVAQQVDPGSPGYLTAETIELSGALDADLFRRVAAEVLERCHTLHMRFEWADDTLWQHPQPPQAEVPLIDFSAEPDPQRAAEAWMQASLAQACDVTAQAIYRSALLKTAADRHAWYLQVHHIALDGFGYSLVQQAVAQRYNALVAGRTPPPLPEWQLDGVIEAEAAYKRNGGFEADRSFWREHLRHVPAPAQIAAAQEPSDNPLRHALVIEPDSVAALQNAARAAGSDWAAWMLAATGLWFAQQSGQRELCFGIPVMNRLGTPALGVPCMAMNIVPFSVRLRPEMTVRQAASEAAAQLRAIRPHLFYRYGWIRGDLGLLQSGKFLFNQAVNLMPFERHVAFAGIDSAPSAELAPSPPPEGVKELGAARRFLESRMRGLAGGPVKDLNFTLVVEQGVWRLTLEANPQAYSAERVRELAESFRGLLDELAHAAPDTPLARWMAAMPEPSVCAGEPVEAVASGVMPLLCARVEATSAQTAIEWRGGKLSYVRLLSRVSALAAQLSRQGVARGDTVAVLLPRSADPIVAALAVLWVGAVYAPLDAEGPPLRTGALLEGLRPKLVLSAEPWQAPATAWPVLRVDQPFESDAAAVPCHIPTEGEPAYLLHTSGSTGTPKAVEVGQGALAHFVASTRSLYRITPADRVLQFAPLHFDASLEEIFTTLCAGATLVLRDDAMLDSAETFAAEAERLGVTVLDLPTAYWHALTHGLDADSALRLRGVRLVIVGGEAVLAERATRWAELVPNAELLNTYGPTETSIIATTAALSGPQAVWRAGEAVPIGHPRPGLQLRVADERLYPAPAGRNGELLISGPALALGYRGDEATTAQRFITLPDTGERAYRTGDLVQWSGGQLRFIGRIDREIKISGLRIDPLEIENALLAVPEVKEAVVLPRRHAGDVCTLEAFVVGTVEPAGLRAALLQSLPAPAVPDQWHVLADLPRNANGKIDRGALALRRPSTDDESYAQKGSADPIEQVVMQAWREVLGEVSLAPGSNFFDLGGKSLQAIQVASRLAQSLQRDVAVSLLFRHATVQSFARALEAPAAHRPPGQQDPFAPLLNIQNAGADAPQLFCLHPAEGLAWSYLRLARHLPQVTLHGLQMDVVASARAESFDVLVDSYVQRVLALQTRGPYRLLGWSLGGAYAQAIASRLQARGAEVGLLALLDCYPAEAWAAHPVPQRDDALRTLLGVNGEFDTAGVSTEALMQRLLRAGSPFAGLGVDRLNQWSDESLRQAQLFRRSSTPCFSGPTVFYRAQRNPSHMPRPEAWGAAMPEFTAYVEVDSTHDGMSDPKPMAQIGADLALRLAQAKEVTA